MQKKTPPPPPPLRTASRCGLSSGRRSTPAGEGNPPYKCKLHKASAWWTPGTPRARAIPACFGACLRAAALKKFATTTAKCQETPPGSPIGPNITLSVRRGRCFASCPRNGTCSRAARMPSALWGKFWLMRLHVLMEGMASSCGQAAPPAKQGRSDHGGTSTSNGTERSGKSPVLRAG